LKETAFQLPLVIAYVSCDPATLFFDIDQLQQLSNNSYIVEKIIPFDMFPQTNHVETLAILKRAKMNLE
jgi:23S rRNA (uracil1939-C5)-methyltransferase